MAAKTWGYTLNNWTEEEYEHLKNIECNYHVIGKEIGEKEGTPHLQGCITFKTVKKIRGLKKIDKRAHWYKVNSVDDGRNYCMKDDKAPFIKDNTRQGERTDLIILANKLNGGASVQDVAREFPREYIKFHNGIEKYANIVKNKIESSKYSLVECCKHMGISPLNNYFSELIIGPSGCGKTQFALAHFERPILISHIDNLLSFDPNIHDGIVFDDMDFRHWHQTHQIHLVDYDNNRSIHCRYRTADIPAYTRKIFTCNDYPFDRELAISRRLVVTEVTKGNTTL